MQTQKLLLVIMAMSMLACSDGGSQQLAQLEPNRVDALGLPRNSEQVAVQQLLQEADDFYELYTSTGSDTYYDRHWAASEGARMIIDDEAMQEAQQLEVEDLFDMPTEVEDDDLAEMPMGRA